MIIYMRNNFRFASLLLAAVMLFASCDETKPEITDEPDEPSIKDGELVLVTDKQIITSDGKDAATLTASIGDEVLTEGVTLYDGNDEIIELQTSSSLQRKSVHIPSGQSTERRFQIM